MMKLANYDDGKWQFLDLFMKIWNEDEGSVERKYIT